MSRRPTTSRGARVLVVCPTEYGGQIEHAADTAMADQARAMAAAAGGVLGIGGGHDGLRSRWKSSGSGTRVHAQ